MSNDTEIIAKCFSLLGSKRRLDVWFTIHTFKHVTLTDISKKTGIHIAHVSTAIKELEDIGLVISVKLGRRKYPTPNLKMTKLIKNYFEELFNKGTGNETKRP